MSRRFFELAVLARRSVARATNPSRAPTCPRLTARRQLGGELTQFSFRLAFVIDVAYVSLGALGGAALGRATMPNAPAINQSRLLCTDSTSHSIGAKTVPNTVQGKDQRARHGLPRGVIR